MMRGLTIISVLAVAATVNGYWSRDCQSNCLEDCTDAIAPTLSPTCTMVLGFGPRSGGWFQTDSDPSAVPTCQESCEKTCKVICENGGIPASLSGTTIKVTE